MDEIPVAQRKVNTTPQNKPFPFSIFLALGSAIITMSLFGYFLKLYHLNLSNKILRQ